jgi:hypothetical protein
MKMRQTAPNNHNPQPKPHLQGNVGHSDVAVRPADAKDTQMNVTILNFRRLGFQSNGNRLKTATKRNGSASCRRCLPPSPLNAPLVEQLDFALNALIENDSGGLFHGLLRWLLLGLFLGLGHCRQCVVHNFTNPGVPIPTGLLKSLG